MSDEQVKIIHERLLHAAKQDDDNLMDEVFEEADKLVEDGSTFDINYKDGLGNTALHYAVKNTSITILDSLLSYDNADVDPQNRLEGDTPLHLVMRDDKMDKRAREFILTELIDAGANFHIKNKHNQKPFDVLSRTDNSNNWIEDIYKESQVQKVVDDEDVVDDDDIADDGVSGDSASESD